MKIAFLGAGRVVLWQLERFKKYNQLEVLGFYDINQEVRDRLVRDGYRSFNSIKELAESEANVIVISTPSHEHYLSLKALLNENIKGKIITIEKPTFLKHNDYEFVQKELEKKSLLVLPVFQNRYNKAVRIAKSCIENGDIGNFLNGRIILSWCRPQRYYDQADWRGKWYSDGGALTNQGIHFIDLARYLMGDIRDVSFRMDRIDVDIECENVAVGSLRLENGRLISVDISTTSRPNDHLSEISVYGSKGYISLGGIALNRIKDSSLDLELDIEENFINGYGYGHEKFYLEILNCLSKNNFNSILSNLEDSKKTSAVLNAAYESAANDGKIVSCEGPFSEILGYEVKEMIQFF